MATPSTDAELLPPATWQSEPISRQRRRRMRRQPAGLAPPGLAALIMAVVSSLAWFRPGTHLATGDIGHFVRDRLWAELVPFYGYELTGAGSGTYEIARALELPFWTVGQLFGSVAVGQGLFYTVLAAGTAAAGAFLAMRFARRRWPAVVVGIVAVVNPLTLTSFPNPNTLLATAVAATFAGLMMRPRRERWDGLLLALATLPASYLAVNPPTLVILAVCAIVSVAVASLHPHLPDTRTSVIRIARAIPWLVLLHAWWAVPQALVLFADAAQLGSGVTSVDAWSWSHRNNSLGRIITLNAHWAWHDPSYFPYAPLLDRAWWSWMAYVLPGAAVAGAVLAPRRIRRVGMLYALVGVVAVAFAMGLHEPLDGFGRWMYETVPGWWLFREPVTKWGIVVLFACLPLSALALDQLADRAGQLSKATTRTVAIAGVTLVAITMVMYPWPLVTGHVVPIERPTLPPARSAVPAEWEAVASQLNADPTSGKILLLPVPTFYQSSASWGFHGVPTVPLQLLTRPVIAPESGGYFSNGTDTVAGLARTVQDAVLDGDRRVALRAMRALGVTDVLIRLDQRPGPGQPLSADPDALQAALSATEWADAAHLGKHAATYRVGADDATSDGRVATSGIGVRADDTTDGDMSALVAHLPTSTVLISDVTTDHDQPLPIVAGATIVPGGKPAELVGATRLAAVSTGPAIYQAQVAGDELRIRQAVTVTGHPLPAQAVALPGEPLALDLAGASVPIGDGPTFFAASPTAPAALLVGSRAEQVDLTTAELGDCGNVDGRPLAETDISMTSSTTGGGITLHAGEHSACLMTDLPPLHDGDLVTVSVEHHDGAPARACLYDDETDVCAATDSTSGDGMVLLNVDIDTPLTDARLYLYADGQEQATTITYRDAIVTSPQRLEIELPPRPDSLEVEGRVAAKLPVPPVAVGEPGDLHDCARTDQRSFDEVGLRRRSTEGGGVELAALEHAACVTFAVDGYVPGGIVEIVVGAERVAGRPPRMCLWADGPDSCIGEATLMVDEGEQAALSLRAHVPLGTSGLRLFVYADGAGRYKLTVARYAVPQVSINAGVRWFTAPASEDPPPAVQVGDHRPGRLVAHLEAANQPFILSVADADPNGWDLEGVGDRVLGTATVDGYASGWVIGPGPATDVVAEHRLDRFVRTFHLAWLALAISVVAIGIAVERRRRRGP